MGAVVVCGGGMVGLAAALMLARDGHEVTVLETDAHEPPPACEAWSSWERRGVAQFRQPHSLFARVRHVWEAELPDLPGRMLDAGCITVDPLTARPPTVTDRAPRVGDRALRAVTGRRPVVEAVLAATAAEADGLRVRRGERVTGLLTGGRPGAAMPDGAPAPCPHVVGVRTARGEEIRADLVVDATGRRGPGARWLDALGAALSAGLHVSPGLDRRASRERAEQLRGNRPTCASAPRTRGLAARSRSVPRWYDRTGDAAVEGNTARTLPVDRRCLVRESTPRGDPP